MQYPGEVSIDKHSQKRSRWRVVLVRMPAEPSPLWVERHGTDGPLPRVLRTTHDLVVARQTVERLRAEGASVVLIEEPSDDAVFCPDHTTALATARCRVCKRRICARCIRGADDEPLCGEHAGVSHNRKRLIRLRQLFLLFLFSAFLYQVARFTQTDRERVSPNGPVHVAVLQYLPPQAESAPIVRYLNDPRSPHQLDRIRVWYDAERIRYGASGSGYMTLTVFPPQPLTEQPPALADAGDAVWQIALGSWRYLRFFERLAEQQGIRDDDFGAHVFVMYGAASDLAAHSRGSERGRLAVAHVDLRERNPAYALTTIAHELGHVLGAGDTYDPDTFHARYPEGFVEPFAAPLYPQRFAELMAVDVPVHAELEAEVRDLSQVRIGYETASQMGWISPGAARGYYTPPQQRPEDRLPPRPVPITDQGGTPEGGEGG